MSEAAYFLRWSSVEGETAAPPMRFSTRADAMDCAGAIVYLSVDVWVEDETGSRVADRAMILRHLDLEAFMWGEHAD